MVLDLGLPDEDGLHFLARIRQKKYTLPVLILTARDTLTDKIAGLDVGADDYLVKPLRWKSCTPVSAPCYDAIIIRAKVS